MDIWDNFIIRNSGETYGVLIQFATFEFATIEYKIHLITDKEEQEARVDTLLLEQMVEGRIWDGGSTMQYSNNGYFDSFSPLDIIDMHKGIEFVWKRADKLFYKMNEK